MKSSIKSSFFHLVLAIILAVLLLTISGRLTSLSDAAVACAGWPFCIPDNLAGWIQFLHRGAVALSSLLMVLLLQQAWSRFRDVRLVLPLATTTVIFFFAQAFTGGMAALRDYPLYLRILHSITAVALWGSLGSLLIATLSRAGEGTVEFPPLSFTARVSDYMALTKPIVVTLLLVTTYAGMVVGAKAWPGLAVTFWTLLGGALAAGGSSALNQYIDRDLDRNMQRTARRPIPAGRMMPAEGLSFGIALCIVSFYVLAGFVNLLAALLSLAGIVYYVLLYSILLKKITVQNIVIGGGAGAIPPVVGWAAVTGRLDVPALFLFAIVFFWTPPHFWALAIVRQKDYARAGVPMLPVIRGEKETRLQILVYTIELVALTLLMPIFKMAGSVYLVLSIFLGLWLIHTAWQVYRQEGNKVAWKMYRYSSIYLAFLFIALMVDAVV